MPPLPKGVRQLNFLRVKLKLTSPLRLFKLPIDTSQLPVEVKKKNCHEKICGKSTYTTFNNTNVCRKNVLKKSQSDLFPKFAKYMEIGYHRITLKSQYNLQIKKLYFALEGR